jgi:rare lipoprotein A
LALGLCGLLALGLSACVGAPQPEKLASPPAPPAVDAYCKPSFSETGLASWYGEAFHMRATASGEPFDMNDLTAAHRWLPLNTIVRVTNLETGKSAVLRINDRGPYVRGRVLDVSRYAAKQLGMKRNGIAPVSIEVFDLEQRTPGTNALLTANQREGEKEDSSRIPEDRPAPRRTVDR